MPRDLTPTAELLVACIHDPLGFVRAAFNWGEGELAGESGPDEWQTELLAELGRLSASGEPIRLAVASGHGVGKTALVAWVILWAELTRPNLAGVVTANTQNQLSGKTWAELSRWRNRLIGPFKAMVEWTATRLKHTEAPERWFVEAVPWTEHNSEAFAGLHAEHVLAVYDEASAISDRIWEVTEGAMTTAGAMWLAFGNPTRNTGRFAECWGKFRHRWRTWRVDSRKAKKADQAQIERWIEDYGEDSDFARVRIKGEFPRAGSNQFIGNDLVSEARKRIPTYNETDPLVMGVDVARHGDDRSVIFFRRGRDARTIPPIKLRIPDLMQVAAKVAEAYREHKADAIFVDMGMGAGVVDRLKQLNIPAIGVEFGSSADGTRISETKGSYANKRAEMWGNVKGWLPYGAIPDDDELRDDLTGPEYGFNIRDEIQLEKKEDMKKRGVASPDMGDALALTFAFVARKAGPQGARKPRPGGGWMAA